MREQELLERLSKIEAKARELVNDVTRLKADITREAEVEEIKKEEASKPTHSEPTSFTQAWRDAFGNNDMTGIF